MIIHMIDNCVWHDSCQTYMLDELYVYSIDNY